MYMSIFDRCVPVFGNVLPGALPSDEVSRVTFWLSPFIIEAHEGMTDHQRGTRAVAAKNRHIVSYKVLPSNKPAHLYASCIAWTITLLYATSHCMSRELLTTFSDCGRLS